MLKVKKIKYSDKNIQVKIKTIFKINQLFILLLLLKKTANMLMNQQQPPTDPNNPMQPNPNHQMMNPNNNFFNVE